MAEYTENQIRFGWLNKSEMLEAIHNGDLNEYDVCFTKDTHEEFIINSKLEPISIKSRLRIYGSVDAATQDINEDKTLTYPGEILSIRDGEKFIAYVVNELDNEYFVTPVYADRMIDYNGLQNVPIKNLEGSVTNPIILADLDDGLYKITGHFIIPTGNEVTSIVGNFIIVEQTGLNEKSIKRINSNSIFDYYIKNENVRVDEYVTNEYMESKGYATKQYVDSTIAALEISLREYIREYVETTCTLLIRNLIDDELNMRYSTEQDIEGLFN